MANTISEALKKKAGATMNAETVKTNLDTAIAQTPQTVPEMDAVFDGAMEEIKFALDVLIQGFNMLADEVEALKGASTPMPETPEVTPEPTQEIPPTAEV
jgi:ferritin-like metal-binding protein YciE